VIERARSASAPPGKGNLAQDRGAQAPPPGKLAETATNTAAQAPRSSSSRANRRRLGQAGARPRLAGGLAAARQNPQRRLRRKDKLAQNQQLTDLMQALGSAPARIIATEDLRYEK